jgi:hypothetical protein
MICVAGSVVDPDPLGSAFIWMSWIRIPIRNADPDPDPGAWKLTKIDQKTLFSVFLNGFFYLRRCVFSMFFI